MSTTQPARALSAPEALGAAALAFLKRYPPFDELEDDALRFMGSRLSIGYYAAGSVILGPHDGVPEWLYIVMRGAVEVRPLHGSGAVIAELAPGEYFSIGALLEQRAPGPRYVATRDTFCYQLKAADFQALLEHSTRFRDFSTSYLASLLRDSRRLLRMHVSAYAGEEMSANRSLRSIVQRPPVCCSPQASIEEALRAMERANIGSILVVDTDQALAGILTRHDLLDRIALARRDLAEPVASVMTPRPHTLDAEASAYDAALLIARAGVRHVPVMEAGKVIGVVTERDLFALQRGSMRGVRRAIAQAEDAAALVIAAREIRTLATMMLEHAVGAEQITYIISTLNDALTERAIDIVAAKHALGDVRWCWLAFGSEGRYEQTISTDQDNGIVFADTPDPHGQRERLLPFARAVNETLAECGFPLCSGDIMAGNPQWCLSVSEWQGRFERWVQDTDRQELLHSVIFFDLRPIGGARELADPLRDTRDAQVAARPVFLRLLAQFAIETRPPLGFLGGFADDDPSAPDTINLKRSGARIYTDAARVLALAAGVPHTNTAQRLRLAGAKLSTPADEIAAAVDGFFFIQSLRLRTQLFTASETAAHSANRIDPRQLNEVDRRMLKESFRQARKLQARLALDYQL